MTLCKGNLPAKGGFSSRRPVTRIFDVFFYLHLKKRSSKQSRRRWLETPLRLLWRNITDQLLLFFLTPDSHHHFCNNLMCLFCTQSHFELWFTWAVWGYAMQCNRLYSIWHITTRASTVYLSAWDHCIRCNYCDLCGRLSSDDCSWKYDKRCTIIWRLRCMVDIKWAVIF